MYLCRRLFDRIADLCCGGSRPRDDETRRLTVRCRNRHVSSDNLLEPASRPVSRDWSHDTSRCDLTDQRCAQLDHHHLHPDHNPVHQRESRRESRADWSRETPIAPLSQQKLSMSESQLERVAVYNPLSWPPHSQAQLSTTSAAGAGDSRISLNDTAPTGSYYRESSSSSNNTISPPNRSERPHPAAADSEPLVCGTAVAGMPDRDTGSANNTQTLTGAIDDGDQIEGEDGGCVAQLDTTNRTRLRHAQTVANMAGLSLRHLRARNRQQRPPGRGHSSQSFRPTASADGATGNTGQALLFTDSQRTSIDLAHEPLATSHLHHQWLQQQQPQWNTSAAAAAGGSSRETVELDDTYGRAVVAVVYSRHSRMLTIHLESIVDLPAKALVATSCYGTQLEVCLLPDKRTLKPVPPVAHTLSPVYNTEWHVALKEKQLSTRTLRIGVLESPREDYREAVGFALLPLDGVVGATAERYTVPLQRHWLPGAARGRLLLSTVYTPDDEQLCVVVHKLEQLVLSPAAVASCVKRTFVKVSLRCGGEKVCTRRTPTESIVAPSGVEQPQHCHYQAVFTFSVPAVYVDDTRLVFTVMTVGRSLRSHVAVGRALIGPYRRQSSNRITQWGQTLDQPATQITRWQNIYE